MDEGHRPEAAERGDRDLAEHPRTDSRGDCQRSRLVEGGLEISLPQQDWGLGIPLLAYRNVWYCGTESHHAPRENFNEDEVFVDWEITKTRIAKGIENPFDIKA